MKTRWKVTLIGIVITALIVTLSISNLNKQGIARSRVIEHGDIERLMIDIGFQFNIPELLSKEDNLVYKNIYGNIAEISNENVVFKAAIFIDEGADLEGDYGRYETEDTYNVKGDTIIKYLKIRTNDYGKGAVISYHTGDVAYSLKIRRETSFFEILDILGLSEENLGEVKEVSKGNTREGRSWTDREWKTYIIESIGYKLKLPKDGIIFIEEATGDGHATIFISNKPVMAIEELEEERTIENVKTERLKGNYVLKYYKQNPFRDGTEEHHTYQTLIDGLERVVESFELIE